MRHVVREKGKKKRDSAALLCRRPGLARLREGDVENEVREALAVDPTARVLGDLAALERDKRVTLLDARLAVLANVDASDAVVALVLDRPLEQVAQVLLLDLLGDVGDAKRRKLLPAGTARSTGVARALGRAAESRAGSAPHRRRDVLGWTAEAATRRRSRTTLGRLGTEVGRRVIAKAGKSLLVRALGSKLRG